MIKNNLVRQIGNVVYDNLPKITVFGGIVGVTYATVKMCQKTRQLDDVLAPHKAEIEEIKMEEEVDKKALTKAYASTVLDVSKLYAAPVTVYAVSTTSIVFGFLKLDKRYRSALDTVDALTIGLAEYRERVREYTGEEVERDLYYGIKHDKITVEEEDENGKKKKVKKEISVADLDAIESIPYSRHFDDSIYVTDNEDYNMNMILTTQNYVNEIWEKRGDGIMTLNEVYRELGLPPCDIGQDVGWYFDKEDPYKCKIDFGAFKVPYVGGETIADYLETRKIIICPNVQGSIRDKFATGLVKGGKSK